MTSSAKNYSSAVTPGSIRYYSLLFLDDDIRQAATALESLRLELAAIGVVSTEPAVAQAKLSWWRGEIENLFQGTPQHPISRALSPYIRHYNLPQELFEEMLDGRDMDLSVTHYDSYTELALFLHRNTGVASQLTSEIFGYRQRQTDKYAHALGLAIHLCEIIFNIRSDLHRGRIYLPLDELERFAVQTDDLMQLKHNKQFHSLLEYQAQRAREHFRHAEEMLADGDRYAQRGGLILARLYQATLDEVAADGFNVLQRRVELTPLRKFWLAWRTHRQEKRQHRKNPSGQIKNQSGQN